MYLLDSQQIIDLFSRDTNRPVHQWLIAANPRRSDLFVSVISLGQVAYTIEQLGPSPRTEWRRLYQAGRRRFESAGGILAVDYAVTDMWQASLRGEHLADIAGADEQLGEDDRLVLATALSRGYSLVTTASPILDAVARRTTLTLITL